MPLSRCSVLQCFGSGLKYIHIRTLLNDRKVRLGGANCSQGSSQNILSEQCTPAGSRPCAASGRARIYLQSRPARHHPRGVRGHFRRNATFAFRLSSALCERTSKRKLEHLSWGSQTLIQRTEAQRQQKRTRDLHGYHSRPVNCSLC